MIRLNTLSAKLHLRSSNLFIKLSYYYIFSSLIAFCNRFNANFIPLDSDIDHNPSVPVDRSFTDSSFWWCHIGLGWVQCDEHGFILSHRSSSIPLLWLSSLRAELCTLLSDLELLPPNATAEIRTDAAAVISSASKVLSTPYCSRTFRLKNYLLWTYFKSYASPNHFNWGSPKFPPIRMTFSTTVLTL